MKFDSHRYWKHDDCMDVFISISGIDSDNGIQAEVWPTWWTQGTESYWMADSGYPITIKPEHYSKWKPYTPKGELKY